MQGQERRRDIDGESGIEMARKGIEVVDGIEDEEDGEGER